MLRSTLARFVLAQSTLLVSFVAGFAWFASQELDYLLDRRDRQIVAREISRIMRTGSPEAVRSDLEAREKADLRVTPDIFHLFVPRLGDCASRRDAPIGTCADIKSWASPEILGLALPLRRLVDANPSGAPEALQREVEFHGPWYRPWYYVSARRVGADAALLVGIDRSLVVSEITGFWLKMIAAFAGFLALLTVGAVLTVRTLMRGIGRVNATLDHVAAGALHERVRLDGLGQETAVLGRHVNSMLDRIDEMVSSLRRFADQVAHELRTPLTRVRTRLENIEAGAAKEELRPRIDASLADLDSVLGLFNVVLQIARFEAESKYVGETVDLDAVLRDLIELYEPSAAEKGQTIVAEIEPVRLIGHHGLVQRLAANVLDNAIKYSSPGSEIRISCGSTGGSGFFEIADRGPGLSAEEREVVFQLGRRGAVAGRTPGAGLGLYIVKVIARLHGITVTARDNNPGLCLHFRFPTPHP